MSLEELVSTYGYTAITLGTFLEGETILVLGGFAAHRGMLELPWVMVCAFLGSFAGDQLAFFLGRTKGDSMLAKRPSWREKSTKVLALLDKHQTALILGFRFLYGLRSVTPFLLGTARIPWGRFVVLNLIGAVVWAIVVGSLGYSFGLALESILGDIERYELQLFGVITAVGIAFWLRRRMTQKSAPGIS
jgi:membrane protein DedA with SNARE-associated domain